MPGFDGTDTDADIALVNAVTGALIKVVAFGALIGFIVAVLTGWTVLYFAGHIT